MGESSREPFSSASPHINIPTYLRWVPYKQTNGVAVYYLDGPSSSHGLGGEYMVSATVRGSPADVLDVLINGSANTTILGPASRVEVLNCQQQDDNVTKSVG